VEETVMDFDTAGTLAIKNEDWFDYEHSAGVFALRLLCRCGESVVVSGKTSVDCDWDEERHRMDYYTVLEPLFFVPPLALIAVEPVAPEQIHRLIRSASEVFWSNGEACLNRLRCVTEEILNILNIPSRTETGGYINLHHRIEKIGTENQRIKDALLAAKHMGNDASHSDFQVTRGEVLDAFQVVEYCLRQLYPVDDSVVLEIISRVNANAGFRTKNRENG